MTVPFRWFDMACGAWKAAALVVVLIVAMAVYTAFGAPLLPTSAGAAPTAFTLDRDTFNFAVAVLSAAGWIYLFGFKLGRYDLKIETLWTRNENMWKFLTENALIEARQRGVVQTHSPERLNPALITHFGELGDEIRRYYRQERLERASDADVMWKLYMKFQDRLATMIHPPLIHNLGDAIAAALRLCRDAAES